MNAHAAAFSDRAALSGAHRTRTGCWTLAAGRAVSLQPGAPGVLNIVQGRVWATLNGPHARLRGDLFLEVGERLHLQAGQRVVIEPFGRAGQPDAAFDWVPETDRHASRWSMAVAQPASDLRLALGSAGLALRSAAGALVRLAGGVLGLAPAGFSGAIASIARRDRLTLGTPACRPELGFEGPCKGV